MDVFRQSGCIRAKVVVNDQTGCIREKWLYQATWLYSGKSGCTRAKVVVFG